MKSAIGTAPQARTATRSRYARPLALAAVILALIGGYFAYDRLLKPQPVAAPAPQQVAVSRGSIVATVSATGSVEPAATVDLAFASGGELIELNASVGLAVKKGDVLARLNPTDLQLEVLKAEAQLATAQSSLANMETGSTSAQIAQARAQVTSAQAKITELRAGATAADLLSAEAAVTIARLQLNKAQDDLADLKAGPSDEQLTSAEIAIERARIALQDAQAAYDKVAWMPNVKETQQAMALWEATTDYEAAQLAYDEAVAGATATETATAEGNVESAKAQLASAEAKLAALKEGATQAELASAEAALLQAQASLEQTLNPTTEAELQAARANVEQAKVAVASAKANLEKGTLVAPFDGVVSTVNGAVGQRVTGTIVTLLDLSAPLLQISLPETEVAKIEVGQQATLTFEALGGQMLTGKVQSITPKATLQSGVATYPATISMETPTLARQGLERDTPSGEGLQPGQAPATGGFQRQGTMGQGLTAEQRQSARAAAMAQMTAQVGDITKVKPGMTASAEITYLRKDDVLTVPNRAIKAQGRDRVVEVLVDGQSETRVVEVGVADDSRTEITSGLEEGDIVMVQSSTTTTSTNAPSGPGVGGVFIGPGLGGEFKR